MVWLPLTDDDDDDDDVDKTLIMLMSIMMMLMLMKMEKAKNIIEPILIQWMLHDKYKNIKKDENHKFENDVDVFIHKNS